MPKKPHIAKDDLKDEIEDQAAGAEDQLAEIAANAGRYARKVLDETHHLGESADAFAAAIREKPVQSALIALGVGAVLGMLIRRS